MPSLCGTTLPGRHCVHALGRARSTRLFTVLDWLVHDWHFLGFSGQIWMPLMAAALAAYIAALLVMRRRRTGSR
jgi:hypothetical protein